MISLLAALPIIAVIIALAVRLSTTLAAALGLALTLVVMVIAFPLPAQAIPGLVQDWLPVTVEVLLIILGGIAFAELGRRSGGQRFSLIGCGTVWATASDRSWRSSTG